MKTPFYILLVILIIALIVFLIWNIILFNKRIAVRNESKEYYELKYQLQFYVAIFSVLIGVFSFLGYNSYNDIVDKVKIEISNETKSDLQKSKDEINSKILATQNELQKISFENEKIKQSNTDLLENNDKTNDRFYKLYEQFLSLNKELYISENKLQSQINNVNDAEIDVENIKTDIAEIKKIDFLNQVYLVTDITFNEPDEKTFGKLDTIYFKNLKTIGGNKLPAFQKPPSITISPYQGVQLALKDVTNQYYTIYMWTKTEFEEKKKHKYDVLIIYKGK
ncbi:hypothetical protein ACMDB5_10470 [Flavobacterium sp. W1B]|uniref:hypothetical protein n=1 Tax=Flavobacterium sp. W1B TaxID=3394146 RepID=UPI0039BD31EB